jgi:hypothetical protein
MTERLSRETLLEKFERENRERNGEPTREENSISDAGLIRATIGSDKRILCYCGKPCKPVNCFNSRSYWICEDGHRHEDEEQKESESGNGER